MRRAKLIAAIAGRLLLIVGAGAHYFGRDYGAAAVLLLMLVALELVDVERALRTPRLAIRRRPEILGGRNSGGTPPPTDTPTPHRTPPALEPDHDRPDGEARP